MASPRSPLRVEIAQKVGLCMSGLQQKEDGGEASHVKVP